MEQYIKIKKQIKKEMLDKIQYLKYMQNLRDGIEVYNESYVENFLDSIREFILLNEIDMRIKKMIVFWIDFIIQNYGNKVNKKIRKKINDIIVTLDIYPLLYEKNYKEKEEEYFNIFDEISIKIREKDNKILSNTQYFVRNKVLEKKNIIFSAPTSFGKSTIVINAIKELIIKNEVNKILFILPTKALINEYRRKIKKVIEDIVIIENPHVANLYVRVIYVFTPERFLVFYENNKNLELDYVVNDEAQSLININKKKCTDRTILLAKALSILSNKNIPMIFLMPYIVNPLESFVFKYINIKKEDIIQVSDNILPFVSNNYYMLDINEDGDLFRYDFSKDAGIEYVNKKYIGSTHKEFDKNKLTNWGAVIVDNIDKIIDIEKNFIIFCTNKKEVKLIAKRMMSNDKFRIDKVSYRMQALINYIEKNLGPEFEYIDFLKSGIAIHFSEIDSYIRRQVEIIFNEENDIKGMICTSTLLQGVNLNAQNLIMIYGRNFSSIGNVEIDYRNLIGRSARLGINIQGNIYNVSCCKDLDNAGSKLYKSSEPVKINFDKIIDEIKKNDMENDIIKTYATDSDVKTKLKEELNSGIEYNIDNMDYFIGYENAKKIEKKISNENVDYYVELLQNIGNYEKTLELLQKMSILYEWKENNNFDVSIRMENIEYITRLAINVFNGVSVQKIIENNIDFIDKNKQYLLVVRENMRGTEFVTVVKTENYDPKTMKMFNRENDINIYIYTLLYDIQNIIEFHLKKYIQDLYYRIKKIKKEPIVEVEEILDYSTKDSKKIALSNIGIVDSFAIDILIQEEYANFYKEDGKVKIKQLKEYAKELPKDDPLRYAILDVL